MINFIFSNFEAILKDIKLYGAIINILYGLPHNAYHLFNIFEMYNTKFKTFFTPVSKLGLPLHEMFEVSLLSMGELSHEEIVSITQEL